MIIVSGYLLVAAEDRAAYLEECRQVVAGARVADGCLDFALSPDLLDARRINITERWDSAGQLAAFRSDGGPGDLTGRIESASVAEYDVAAERPL